MTVFLQSLIRKTKIKQLHEEIITEVVALKRAILAFSGMRILHGVVVLNPVQDISKDVVRKDMMPQELLQVQIEQGVTSTVHSMELTWSLDICSGTLHHVGVQCRVVGINKVQLVVDHVVWLWQLIVSLPAISYVCIWKDMLSNDGK